MISPNMPSGRARHRSRVRRGEHSRRQRAPGRRNRVLVNVQLIDAIHDRHLWSERYDRTLTNSIGLQGELATEIAQSLRARLNPKEKGLLASKPTNNPEAYVLYLQAHEKERTALSYEDRVAVDAIYDRAVSLDPQFASAMARQSLWNSGMYMDPEVRNEKTRRRLWPCKHCA